GRADFDLSGGQVGVDGAFGPGAHDPFDAQHPFVAHAVRGLAAGLFGVDHHLHEPGRVAHVEEHDTAVVAPVRDPSAHDDVTADVLGPQITGAVRPHHEELVSLLVINT